MSRALQTNLGPARPAALKPVRPVMSRATRAILAILAAAILFAAAAACVKGLGGAVPVFQVMLFRNLFALPVLFPMLRGMGGLRALRTSNAAGHAWRTFFGLVGMGAVYYGYAAMPLAAVTALGFAMPLFLTLLAVPLLGETVGWRRGSAVLIGFAGVLVMVRPWAEGDVPLVPALIVLAGSLSWALAMISIRRLGEAGEPGVSIVLWFAIGSALVSGILSLPGWIWPEPWQWALLVGTGAVSALAQLLMTEAYRSGEPTLVAPFEYSGIVWTTLLGVLFWAEAPDLWDGAGILILVASGLYIWHREMQLGLKR